jgi:diacylglycerol O-acyltransferase / wax synthase
MALTKGLEYLSFGDALFLHLEREGTPLNIASLAIFDGELSTTDVRRFVASKLPQIPRYMQRVVVPPFNMGLPHWEFATDFKLTDHIHEISMKRGTISELKSIAAKILSPTMDRRHPLWDLTLIHGLKQRRTGMIVRIHHCLADGISGMGLLNVLMDSTPEVPVLKDHKIRVPRAVLRAPGADLVDSAMQSWFSVLERLLQAGNEVLTLAQRATVGTTTGNGESNEHSEASRAQHQDQMMRLATELAGIPDRLPFNVLCQGPQRYEWTEVPLGDLKAIRNACGTTTNDVVLAILTAAFRRYTKLRGVNVRGRSIRIVVPVSTRDRHQSAELGNHISFAPFSAPLGISNPRKLLEVVHERMEFVKSARVAEFVSFAGTLLGAIPTPMQAVLAPVLSELPISVCNTICTNVPGPKKPLYLLGHEMLSAYPYVPIGGEMGINCAVLSYNGTVYFGFTGDEQAAPDLQKFPACVDESVAELKAAFGLREPRASRKNKAPRAQEAVPEVTLVNATTSPETESPEPRRKPMARATAADAAIPAA